MRSTPRPERSTSAAPQRHFAADEAYAPAALIEHQRAARVDADHVAGGNSTVGQHYAHRLFLQGVTALPLGHEGREAVARVAFQDCAKLGENECQQAIAVERASAVDR